MGVGAEVRGIGGQAAAVAIIATANETLRMASSFRVRPRGSQLKRARGGLEFIANQSFFASSPEMLITFSRDF
jgi:hypothetical protein